MNRIFTLILLIISFKASSQTLAWSMWDNFDNFSYSASVCRIDANDNIYTKYSTTIVQYGNPLAYIEKYNTNGERVTAFGSNGVLDLNQFIPGTGSKFVYSFDITNNGKFLFLVRSGSFFYFLKLNPEGTLDTTLNGTGITQILSDSTRYNEHMSISLIKGGDYYYVLDNFETNQNVRFAEVHCFDDSGNLVTSFANQGHLLVNYGPAYTSFCAIANIFYENNSLYIYGYGYVNSTTYDRYLTKLNPLTAIPDANFGNNGQLLFNGKAPSLIQANGKIIHIRTVNISPAQQDLQATRYLSDGTTIDNSFATNGTLTLAAGWTGNSFIKPYNLPNGDIFLHYRLSLFASDSDAVKYVTASGAVDTSFGGNIIDNGNPVLGTFGLPTYKANPGSLSFGANYFVATSDRQALPQNITTSKVNFSFPALSKSENIQHNFRIWPNPSESEINIVSNDGFTAVRLYSIEGKLLKSSVTTYTIFENRLDIRSLSKGVYIVEVEAKSRRDIQKLIKN